MRIADRKHRYYSAVEAGRRRAACRNFDQADHARNVLTEQLLDPIIVFSHGGETTLRSSRILYIIAFLSTTEGIAFTPNNSSRHNIRWEILPANLPLRSKQPSFRSRKNCKVRVFWPTLRFVSNL